MKGTMMNERLTVSSIVRFAEKSYSDSKIFSDTRNGILEYTYGDAVKRAKRLANALRALGAGVDDVVATIAWSDHRHLEICYATALLGGIFHAIGPKSTPSHVARIIRDANDKWLFIDPDFLNLLEPISSTLKGVKGVILLSDKPPFAVITISDIFSYEEILKDQDDICPWPNPNEDDAASYCYTSGTVGVPRGVAYTHRSIILHSYASAMPDAVGLSSNDTLMPIVPIYHANAWGLIYTGIMCGCDMVLPGHAVKDGKRLADLVERYSVSVAAGIPAVFTHIVEAAKEFGLSISVLKRAIIGGATCPANLARTLYLDYGVDVRQGWGMTETGPLGTVNTIPVKVPMDQRELDRTLTLQGKPIFGVDVQIVRTEGQVERAWDGKSIGSIRVKGPWVAERYINDVKPRTDREGYFPTGDLGYGRPDSRIRLTDRTHDAIKSGGEWVSSIDLETIALEHPAIVQAAVIGIYDAMWGERPLVYAKLQRNYKLTEYELLNWFQGRVPKWQLPVKALFVKEFPLTESGRINKGELRLDYHREQSTMVSGLKCS